MPGLDNMSKEDAGMAHALADDFMQAVDQIRQIHIVDDLESSMFSKDFASAVEVLRANREHIALARELHARLATDLDGLLAVVDKYDG